jgi:hypothetical protein
MYVFQTLLEKNDLDPVTYVDMMMYLCTYVGTRVWLLIPNNELCILSIPIYSIVLGKIGNNFTDNCNHWSLVSMPQIDTRITLNTEPQHVIR